MTPVPQPQFFSPLKPMKNAASATQKLQPKSFTFAFKFNNLRVSSSLGPSNSESSPGNSSEKPLESDLGEADPVKLAFAKAKAYKKAIQSNPTPKIFENPVQESDGLDNKSDELKAEALKAEIKDKKKEDEVPLSFLAFEKAKEYRKKNDDPIPKTVENTVQEANRIDKKSYESKAGALKSEIEDKGEEQEVPLSVKLPFEKAKEYRKKKDDGIHSSETVSGNGQTLGLKMGNKENQFVRNDDNKKKELKVSNIDFVGLEFSEKKRSRGLPPGLVPFVDPFAGGDLPEVEILVGDASKFVDGAASSSQPMPTGEEDSNIYKPKVSTWGVFPRPSNISKTYGGGRNIRPGEALETVGDRAAKEAHTRQLLAAYNSKIGLNIDPKLKSECEKALKDGDSLMDLGKLKEALPFYQKVMDKLAFQTELYGLAALQWSICQDSLTRPNEARAMYEKLQSHPNPQVSKKARQLMFGFQAMEMMKVRSSLLSPTNTGYQNYFEAFVRNKTNYTLEEVEVDEGSLSQALIYTIFLLSPILLVILAAVEKRL